MTIQPKEFELGEQRLRYTPLAALPLVREYGRLVKRAGEGALDRLLYMDNWERLSLLSGIDDREVSDADKLDRAVLLAHLLRDLMHEDDADTLVKEYLAIGQVQMLVDGEWQDLLACADELEDPLLLIDATQRVLREILDPLFSRLRASTEKEAEPTSGSDTKTKPQSSPELNHPTSAP